MIVWEVRASRHVFLPAEVRQPAFKHMCPVPLILQLLVMNAFILQYQGLKSVCKGLKVALEFLLL